MSVLIKVLQSWGTPKSIGFATVKYPRNASGLGWVLVTEQVSALTLLCSTERPRVKCARCDVDKPRMVTAAQFGLPCNLLPMSYLAQIWVDKDSEYLVCWVYGAVLSTELFFAFTWAQGRVQSPSSILWNFPFKVWSEWQTCYRSSCYSLMYFKVYFTGNHENFVSMNLQIFTHLAFFIQRKFNSFICI